MSLTRRSTGKTRFFGRLSELQFIDERIFWFLNDEAAKSVIIEGEAGIGKTALMEQIFEMNHGAGVLELFSHCYGAESEVPLRAWRDSFKQLEQLRNEGTVHLSEHGSGALSLMLTGTAAGDLDTFRGQDGEFINYTAIENAVLSLLKELTCHWKIILYFDSLQWMDVVSRRLLQRIMIENDRVFMIATCRSNAEQAIRGFLVALSERAITTPLPLSCFSEADTVEIINEMLQGQRDAGINTHEIFLRTGGHPRALMELLDVIRREGWNADSPLPQLDMAIQFQLERLTPPQKKVLDALSIHLEHADLDDLMLLTELGPMELIEELETLLAAQLITEQTFNSNIIYKFKHQFYKDYIYQHLSLGKRRLWHHVVASSYEQKNNEERRRILLPFAIRHYECSGDMERADALRSMQKAL